MMISIARVSTTANPLNLPEYQVEHEAIFGDSMTITAVLRDPNDPHQIAVVGDVRDLERMRQASRTPEGDAMMRKWGFVEQLSYFLEDA
jgi:hypothetical protein